MQKTINEAYVDVMTGHLHVMMNELFNAKANLVILDQDLAGVVRAYKELSDKNQENTNIISEQIERIRELENVGSSTSTAYQREIEDLKNMCKTLEEEKLTFSKKASHIDTFGKQINTMNDEIKKKDSEISTLNQEIKLLNDMIAELKIATNSTKKLKK